MAVAPRPDDHGDAGRFRIRFQLLQQVAAVCIWKVQIEHYDVGLRFFGRMGNGLPCGDGEHSVAALARRKLHQVLYLFVVVGEEDTSGTQSGGLHDSQVFARVAASQLWRQRSALRTYIGGYWACALQPGVTDMKTSSVLDQSASSYQQLALREPRSRRRNLAKASGRILGAFSLGLGLAELLAPRRLASLVGLPNDVRTRSLLRAFGLRELLAAAGLLGRPVSAVWLWSRVAGDAMDLALLLTSVGARRARTVRILAATTAVAGVTAWDALSAMRIDHRG